MLINYIQSLPTRNKYVIIISGMVLFFIVSLFPQSALWNILKTLIFFAIVSLMIIMFQQNLGMEEEDDDSESDIDDEIEQDWLKIENDQDVRIFFQKFLEDTLQLIKKVLVSNSVILLFANYEKQMFVVRHKITDNPEVFSPQNTFGLDKGLPSLVLRNRTALIENHLPTGQEIIPYYLKDSNPAKSFAAVPIYYKDQIIGVLCTDSGVEEAFSNDDLSILKHFGNQIMLQLFGSNKLYEYESENWLANILFEISQDLNQVQSVDELWKYLIRKIPQVIACDRISISHKINEKQGIIIDIAGGTGNLKSGKTFAVNEGIVGWVIRKNQAILVEDFSHKENYVPRFSSNETPARDYFSLLALPIANNRNLIGVLCLESNRPRNFKEQHKRIMQTICNQAANMYLTTRTLDQLKQISYQDLDTQLENMNAFRFVFPKEFNRASQLKFDISLLFVKCYYQLKEDDHDLSVKTIKEFLNLVLPQLSKSDYIFRLSPDTFGIIVTSQGENTVNELGEKILFKVRDKKIWADGEAFDFYAIVGLVTSEFLSVDIDNTVKLGEKTIKQARLKGPNQMMNYRTVLEEERKADRQLDMLDSKK